jgi:hypothetical protein
MRKTGVIKAIEDFTPGVQLVQVEVKGERRQALNYLMLTGAAQLGDTAVLNTVAVDAGFGTGGYDFVICLKDSESNPQSAIPIQNPEGLLMRLRYTPLQLAMPAAEENFPEAVQGDLEGTPVIACGLHSQIVPVLAGFRVSKPDVRVIYLMTDSAALPIGFSRLVAQLKAMDWIQATITVGQAFGGDLEAVNVYSGMLLAKHHLKADAILVCQGPGNTGTGTTWGFSGIDQGHVLNAAGTLNGKPIAALRMSFADSRLRHQGVSHHSLTVLSRVVLVPCIVPVPILPPSESESIQRQLEETGIAHRHTVQYIAAGRAFEFMLRHASFVRTMGRTPEQDKTYFLAGCAAGLALVD